MDCRTASSFSLHEKKMSVMKESTQPFSINISNSSSKRSTVLSLVSSNIEEKIQKSEPSRSGVTPIDGEQSY